MLSSRGQGWWLPGVCTLLILAGTIFWLERVWPGDLFWLSVADLAAHLVRRAVIVKLTYFAVGVLFGFVVGALGVCAIFDARRTRR